MVSSLDSAETLLDVFEHISRSHVDADAVECGEERWTYGNLDVVSTGLALELFNLYGSKPVVAIVSENHPYVLATILATWKLGGIVAPLDYNLPRDIMERMLLNIKPTVVFVPENQLNVTKIIQEMAFACSPFDAKTTTITALMQKYLECSASLSGPDFLSPTPESIAFYCHTSSASSVNNVKCVPLSHRSILAGSRSRLAWWKRTWPEQNFERLRVLGWSPWSHIIGISHDIVAATFLTRGTYVFAMIPSAYGEAGKASRFLDVSGQLLETAIEKKPTTFSAVPWVLEGFMRTFLQEKNPERKAKIKDAIHRFKLFGSGGAATSEECLKFATELGIPLVLDIGMTEIGSPIFHSTINTSRGWNIRDCMVSDASLTLINEDDSPAADEGELVITSSLICKGYLNYDNSPFTIKDDLVTFRTGDIYGHVGVDRLIWKGRKDDYIQMSSGESLDPRVIEGIIDQCPSVIRSCVVGNNFLGTSSQVVCAIIEPDPNTSFSDHNLAEIIRTIAVANRGLAPPLRISWSRVLILDAGQQIPLTKKGAVFRKKLEEYFGEQLARLLDQSNDAHRSAKATHSVTSKGGKSSSGQAVDKISSTIANIVANVLGVSTDTLEQNSDATFAELGMDSSMSTKIVNQLNQELALRLPLNTCHTHIDIVSLTKSIIMELGIENSHEIPETRASRRPSPEQAEEVVVVGQSVRLPGGIHDPRSFWDALIEQRDDIMTPVPPSRWDHASFYRDPNSNAPSSPCDISLDKAGWIDLSSFDHYFFGLGLSEAFFLAPTIRLTLEMAFEALENANIPLSKIKGSDMGVFVANAMDDGYIQLLFADKGWGAYSRYWATGTAASTASGRLSYLLDIHGPSITVDTACSSGLIALHEAVKYLQSGEGESAIVCGANVHPWPGTLGFLTAQKMTSPNGRCATFTNEADGYVPSEGAAGLVLKTKRAAIRDGDKIIGVVRSTITKHDGRSQGLVAPNVKAQIGMQTELLQKAGIPPSEIDFLEAHGTGTSLGDLIEIQGINEVFKSSHTPDDPLVVGASKSCVGHTELIAGLIGVLKTLGSLRDGMVPGLVQLTENNMNPSLDCNVVPLHIPHENAPLKRHAGRPLRALVLSNGFAGSIAGAILESSSDDIGDKSKPDVPENTPLLFVVSAKTPEALVEYLNKYLDFCLDAEPSLFPSICYTSCVGREHYRHRFASVAHNIQDLIARIEERIQNPPSSQTGNARRILFGFPGQGCQYQGMGRYLANHYTGFREIITESAFKASKLTGYPVLPYLVEDSALPGSISIDNSEVAQVCIYTFQYAMTTWLQSLGVQVHSVMGHSLGEITAAVISEAFSFETGLEFVITRARVLRSDTACPGGMAAVSASEDVVARYITEMGLENQLSIAVYNAADNNVVSGELKALEKLMAAVKRDGMRATKLAVTQGFHSNSISPGLPALRQWLEQQKSTMKGLEKTFFSTVLGKEIVKHQSFDTQYWIDHAQNAVRFLQTAQLVHKSPIVDVIVDIGPQPTVWSNMQTPEFSGKTRLAFTGKRGKDQIVAMLTGLSGLFEKGFNIDFDALHNQMPYRLTMTDNPTYPFQRVHNYPAFVANRHRLLGFGTPVETSKVSVPQFIIDQGLYDFLGQHLIEGRRVVPGAAMVDCFARAAVTKTLKIFRFHVPLVLENPQVEVRADIDDKGLCQLQLLDETKVKICSGNVSEKASVFSPRPNTSHLTPLTILSKQKIYECFKNVQFGDLFHTIQVVKFWETHADGDVKVERTNNPSHDRIRKIDACLHMFGTLSSLLAPLMDEGEGAYLPTSLEEFSLHTDEIPYEFTCRYYLPLEIGRGARTLGGSFDVFANTGELLISCQKYIVAWVPSGVVYKQAGNVPLVSGKKSKRSSEETYERIVSLLREAMELQVNERLDTNEPLTSCGADSITFAQFKGQVLKEMAVDVPVMYLSDDFTIHDMISNIVETYTAS